MKKAKEVEETERKVEEMEKKKGERRKSVQMMPKRLAVQSPL